MYICVVCSVVIPFVRSFYLSLLNCQDKAEAVDEGLIFNVFFLSSEFYYKSLWRRCYEYCKRVLLL